MYTVLRSSCQDCVGAVEWRAAVDMETTWIYSREVWYKHHLDNSSSTQIAHEANFTLFPPGRWCDSHRPNSINSIHHSVRNELCVFLCAHNKYKPPLLSTVIRIQRAQQTAVQRSRYFFQSEQTLETHCHTRQTHLSCERPPQTPACASRTPPSSVTCCHLVGSKTPPAYGRPSLRSLRSPDEMIKHTHTYFTYETIFI